MVIIKDDETECLKTLVNADELHNFSGHMLMDKIAINIWPITAEEVHKAIAQLKRNKAHGLDNITPEVLKDRKGDLTYCNTH